MKLFKTHLRRLKKCDTMRLITPSFVFRTAAVKPRIKPWIDTFVSTSHNITDEQLAEYEANDPFVQALVLNLDGLVKSFRGCLTPGTFDSLVMIVAGEVRRS